MSVRVLVLRTAGVNCELETRCAFELAGASVELVHARALIADGRRRLEEIDILVFPGGFSYGDDLGAGTVLANQLRCHLGEALAGFVAAGKQVLGICNGFQVLVRLGLLPFPGGEQLLSLVENASGLFEDRWVKLRVETARSPILERGELLEMPVAHKEGRLVCRSRELLEELRHNDQIALRYAALGAGGGLGLDPGYPANPNGSLEAIAGLQSPEGNVLGLMPHPERHVRALQHPEWTRRKARGESLADDRSAGDGFRLFRRMVERARERAAAGSV